MDSLPSEPPGKPKNTGVGSLSLCRGSSLLRNWTGVSCIARRFFTSWATREALNFSPIGGYLGYSQFHDGFNFGGLLLSVDCPNEGPFPQIKGSSVTLMSPEIATKLVIKWRYYESQKEVLGNSRQYNMTPPSPQRTRTRLWRGGLAQNAWERRGGEQAGPIRTEEEESFQSQTLEAPFANLL